MKYPKLSPSVLFLITLTIGIFLSWVKPWHWSVYLDDDLSRLIGLILLLISFILNSLAYRMFKKYMTPHAPFAVPHFLIDRGIFALSRNPVYLALVLSQCGIGFIFDTVWLLGTAFILMISLQYLVILFEEKMMESMFNDRYQYYKKHTRRWF